MFRKLVLQILQRFVKSFFVTVYALLFGEVFIRLVVPQLVMPRNVQATAAGIRGNIPNLTYRHTTPETDVSFHINSIGMRDNREFPLSKPEGTCRVELFGDSFFMGYELNLSDTIAARLEKDLQDEGYRAEVLNFSVSGFGTAESLVSLNKNGLPYAPDFVVFEWHSSDFLDNLRSNLFTVKDGSLQPANPAYLPAADAQAKLDSFPLIKYVTDHSQLYSLLRETFGNMFRHKANGQDQVAEDHKLVTKGLEEFVNDHSIILSQALVQRVREVANAANAGFLLADVPFQNGLHIWSTVEMLRLGGDFPVTSPAQFFLEQDPTFKSFYYSKGAGHFSPRGADVMAKQIAASIVRSGKLQACSQSH